MQVFCCVNVLFSVRQVQSTPVLNSQRSNECDGEVKASLETPVRANSLGVPDRKGHFSAHLSAVDLSGVPSGCRRVSLGFKG